MSSTQRTIPLLLLTILTTHPTTSTAASCSLEQLTTAASLYISSQTTGSLDPLTPYLTPSWTYTENNKLIPHTSGTLHKPLKIASNRTIYDLPSCASYTELIAPTGPYVLGTQIRHAIPASNTSVNTSTITSIDTISTTTGAWLFNATATLLHASKESWLPIPANLQDTKEVLVNAADAYLDMWSDKSASGRVPWGTPCNRLEGGAYTGSGSAADSCKAGIPSNSSQKANTERRYVVDLGMGSVSVFCLWGHMVSILFLLLFLLVGKGGFVLVALLRRLLY